MKQITDENFKELIETNKLVVIDFWADWCNPCKALSPMIDELSQEYQDVEFGKLNVEEAPDTTDEFKIKNVPTVIFFKAGKEVSRVVGKSAKEQYIKQIEKHK